MGLFEQQRVKHNDSMALPAEPLDHHDPARSLPEPAEVDLFGFGSAESHVSITIEVPTVDDADGD